jgi:hypothetical protein
MFWALARVSFRAAKIISCNKKKKFMVYLRHYFNCSTLYAVPHEILNNILFYTKMSFKILKLSNSQTR